MSAKWTFWAWEQKIKTAPKKLALLQLANNSNDDGKSWYSIEKMADACGVSDRTFQRQIKDLENDGLLHVERRNNRPSIYELKDKVEITLHSGGDIVTPRQSDGGDTVTPQGDTVTPLGVTECRTILTIDPNSEPNSKDSLVQPKAKRSKYKFDDKDLATAEWMHGRVRTIDPTKEKCNVESWANTIRLMREIDGHTIEDICKVFDFSNKHHFWHKNVLSPDKLRKQYGRLMIEMNDTGPRGKDIQQVASTEADWSAPKGME